MGRLLRRGVTLDMGLLQTPLVDGSAGDQQPGERDEDTGEEAGEQASHGAVPSAFCASRHTSEFLCRCSHSSGIVCSACPRRNAMPGVTAPRSFTLFDSVLRETPRARAA